MDFDRLVFFALVAAIGALVVRRAVRNLAPVLGRRREQRHLDRSGVRAHGVVRSVHSLNRSPDGHTVTVDVRDGHGRTWQAVDPSGTGGYRVPEGTPVELVYSPDDPRLVRVERAALPATGAGDYPLHPKGRPSSGPKVLAAVVPVLVVLPVVGVLGTVSLLPAELIPRFARFVPLLLPVAGAALIVHALRAVGVGRLGSRRYTAETEGTVTDCWTVFTKAGTSSRVPTYPFTVRFQVPDGREVHRRYPFASTAYHPSVGRRVRVRYDPGHPPRFAVRDFTPGLAPTVFPLVSGTLLIVIGCIVSFVVLGAGGS